MNLPQFFFLLIQPFSVWSLPFKVFFVYLHLGNSNCCYCWLPLLTGHLHDFRAGVPGPVRSYPFLTVSPWWAGWIPPHGAIIVFFSLFRMPGLSFFLLEHDSWIQEESNNVDILKESVLIHYFGAFLLLWGFLLLFQWCRCFGESHPSPAHGSEVWRQREP